MTHLDALRTARMLLAGMTLTLVVGIGHAQDSSLDKAREYFQAGAQAYAVGEFAAATQAFEQAYQLVPRPAVLFSIAQAERKQYFLEHQPEHLLKAISLYKRYLDEEPQAARKTDAAQALSELEPLAAQTAAPTVEAKSSPSTPSASTRLMITSQAQQAQIWLDNQPPVKSPLIRQVDPGEHLVRVTAPGYEDSTRKVVAVSGAIITVDLALAERPAKLVVIAREGALLSIDGRVQGECPFPKPLELPAGSHLVTLTMSGFVGLSREQKLVRGETTVISAPMPRSRQRTASYIMLGTAASAVTAGGVFTYFAFQQQSSAQAFLDAKGHERLSPGELSQYDSTRIARDRLRTAAFASVGIGAGLALGGALLIVLDGRVVEDQTERRLPKREGPTITAQPIAGPGIAGAGVFGTF
jgi:hypothetical protein